RAPVRTDSGTLRRKSRPTPDRVRPLRSGVATRARKWREQALMRADGEARAAERGFVLVCRFATQRAQPRVDDRRLIEVAVLLLRRDLELVDRALEVALPRVVLGLVAVRKHLLVLRGVGARGEELQWAVVRKARELLLREARGVDVAARLEERIRIIVDELHLVRIARERRAETLDRGVDLARFQKDVAADGLDHRMLGRHLLELRELELRALVVAGAQQRRDEP